MLPIRKTFALLLPAALLAAPAAASAFSFGAGPILGIEFADASIDGYKKTDGRTGIAAGLRTEFGISDPWSLLIEALYVQKGSEFEAFDTKPRGDLDYLEIPVLAKIELLDIRTMWTHIYAFAGPSVGINLKAEGEFVNFTTFAPDFKDNASKVVVSGDIGAGVAYEFRRFMYAAADVRYSHGFSDALGKTAGDIDSWHSRDVRLQAALFIQLIE